MATEILMPALSPTMEEGTLAKWLVKEGDTVKPGDILAEIETDKATMEFEAVDEGTIGRILVAEGTAGVKVNTPIAVLVEEGESAAAPAKATAPAATPAKAAAPATPAEAAPTPAPAPAETGAPDGERVTASPIFVDANFNVGKPPALNQFVKIVGHWDVAYAGTSTADFNAVRVWGLDKDGRFWLIGCFVKQTRMRSAVDWMIDFDRSLPETVIVHWQYESQFWNIELENTLNEACDVAGHELLIRKAELNKANNYDRILSMAVYYENGRVWFSEKLTGYGDHEVGLDQIRGIEPGYTGHDDAPDADERAITQLSRENRARKFATPLMAPRTRPKRPW